MAAKEAPSAEAGRSSAARFVEKKAMENPLFQDVEEALKDPETREAFREKFSAYIDDAYENDPRARRLMKSYDLSNRIDYLPDDVKNPRDVVGKQMYAEPGRGYHYMNNFVGEERSKKGMLEKTLKTAGGLAKETWPGLGALGGWWWANKWHAAGMATRVSAAEAAKAAAAGVVKSAAAKASLWDVLINPAGTAFNAYATATKAASEAGTAAAGAAAKNTALDVFGAVSTPALYLIGGYLLYKTVKYFLANRKSTLEERQREKLEDLRRRVAMQNQMLSGMRGRAA